MRYTSPNCARGRAVSAPAVREVHTVLSGAFKQTVVWGWTAHRVLGEVPTHRSVATASMLKETSDIFVRRTARDAN
jgi:hypothetical protein